MYLCSVWVARSRRWHLSFCSCMCFSMCAISLPGACNSLSGAPQTGQSTCSPRSDSILPKKAWKASTVTWPELDESSWTNSLPLLSTASSYNNWQSAAAAACRGKAPPPSRQCHYHPLTGQMPDSNGISHEHSADGLSHEHSADGLSHEHTAADGLSQAGLSTW